MDPADYYKPPKADLDAGAVAAGSPLEAKLYTIRQIGVATFLGGPLAGALLMAGNYRAMDRKDSARNAAIVGAVATIAVIALAFVLPDRAPGSILPIAYVSATYGAANATQGPWLTPHFAAGGGTQSNWRVLGIALACLAGLAALGLAAGFLVGSAEGA